MLFVNAGLSLIDFTPQRFESILGGTQLVAALVQVMRLPLHARATRFPIRTLLAEGTLTLLEVATFVCKGGLQLIDFALATLDGLIEFFDGGAAFFELVALLGAATLFGLDFLVVGDDLLFEGRPSGVTLLLVELDLSPTIREFGLRRLTLRLHLSLGLVELDCLIGE